MERRPSAQRRPAHDSRREGAQPERGRDYETRSNSGGTAMNRAKEIVAGFVLMLVASTTAVQFFLTHQRYENSASIRYLVALGVAELFLIGLSWRLVFVPLTKLPTTPEPRRSRGGAVMSPLGGVLAAMEPLDYLEEWV